MQNHYYAHFGQNAGTLIVETGWVVWGFQSSNKIFSRNGRSSIYSMASSCVNDKKYIKISTVTIGQMILKFKIHVWQVEPCKLSKTYANSSSNRGKWTWSSRSTTMVKRHPKMRTHKNRWRQDENVRLYHVNEGYQMRRQTNAGDDNGQK